MESKMAARNILLGIGVERLRYRASSLFRNGCHIAFIKAHVQRLAVNLETIQALLPDAEKKGAASEFVRSWLKRVAAVSSETDILLDECRLRILQSEMEAHQRKQKKVLITFLPLNIVALIAKLAWRAKGINSKFERLLCESFLSGISPAKISYLEFEETSNESSSVGGDDFSKIKHWILTVHQDLCLIPIIGKEGSERTELTRLIFDDDAVVNLFDRRISIPVSQEFNVVDVFKSLFKELGLDVSGLLHGSGKLNEVACETKLKEKLRDRSFLLVLDDVVLGDEDQPSWKSFIWILRRIGGSTSKSNALLVTATKSKVTDYVFPRKHELTEKQSEQIVSSPKVPGIMKTMKETMARYGGRQLLVRLMDMLMYSEKYDGDEWQKTAQDEVCQVDVPEEELLDNMELCYDHLPSLLLKQCLAFCCLFPRDTAIHKEDLVQLWMAHGLLDPPNGSYSNREHRGAMYLNILMQHSFLEESADKSPHKNCCKMSGIFHDLATLISKDFCSIMEGIDVKDGFKAVHVTMIDCKLELSENLRGAFEKLRTLRLVDTGILGDILPHTRHLSALTVVGLAVEELPDSIKELQYLKLLDVSKTRIVQLPDSITELCGLEALRLYDLEKLPKNFQNLVSLSHLYVENLEDSGILSLLPSRYHELIKHASFKASFKACLGYQYGIENLASLEYSHQYTNVKIYRLENVKDKEEATKANLSRMEMIHKLKLHWSGRRENSYDDNVLEGLKPHTNIRHLALENFKGSKFPSWMVKTSHPLLLKNLVTVDFQGCCWCENVPPLGHLPCLQVVKIQGMDNVKHISTEFYGLTGSDPTTSSSTVFPVLRQLSLLGMASLEQWSGLEHRSAFPVLEKLEVVRCPNLTSLPDIFHPDHLQRLQIAFCDRMTAIPQRLQNLEFLDDLDIRGLPSVLELSIRCCNNLTRLTIGGFCSGSQSHAFIHLKPCPRQVALPAELKCFSELRYLAVWGYDDLEALPEWVVSFKSLQTLKLEFCKRLMYFPSAENMQKLTSLDEISISFCPLLEEGCIRGNRPEWDKISHIRRIVINSEDMK